MSRSTREYLAHILDEIQYLRATTRHLTRESFLADPTSQRAFVRSLEVIGEAVKNLPGEFREKHREIDWRSVAGMRDRLIHGYFGVDYELVWDVVTKKIQPLQEAIERIERTDR